MFRDRDRKYCTAVVMRVGLREVVEGDGESWKM